MNSQFFLTLNTISISKLLHDIILRNLLYKIVKKKKIFNIFYYYYDRSLIAKCFNDNKLCIKVNKNF